MPFDQHRPAGQRQHVIVRQHEPFTVLGRHRNAARLPCASLFVDQLELLRPELLLENRPEVAGQCRLEHVELVGIDGALHDAFTKAICAGDQDGVGETRFGIDREHHARAGEIGAHHLLHAHRQGHLRVIEAVMHPVDDGPVGEQRRVAAPHGVEQHRLAVNVEERLLLSRETRLREIFGRCAAAHGHVAIGPVLFLEPSISVLNSVYEVGGQGCGQNGGPNATAGCLQRIDVADVDTRKGVSNDALEIGATHEGPVGVGGCGEAAWRPNPKRGQRPPHLAERGILATDRGDVGHADVIERPDPAHREAPFSVQTRHGLPRPSVRANVRERSDPSESANEMPEGFRPISPLDGNQSAKYFGPGGKFRC